jgi:hypothetical protein
MVVKDQIHGDIVRRLGQAAGQGTHSRKDWVHSGQLEPFRGIVTTPRGGGERLFDSDARAPRRDGTQPPLARFPVSPKPPQPTIERPPQTEGCARARWRASYARGTIARPGRGQPETSMRLPILLLIAAVLIGETQSTSAQSPNGYPWCSRSIRSDAIACRYTSWEQCHSRTGIGGICVQSPWYRGAPLDAPARRRRPA